MAKKTEEKKEELKEVTMSDLLSVIVEGNKLLNKIAEELKESKKVEVVEVIATSQTSQVPVPTTTSNVRFPVPPEFREAVDTHLNKKFGIEIEYKTENAAFGFSVIVPKEYSDATPSYWSTHGEDRRTKVILNALGVNGVREWCQQVYNSFGPEMKSKIMFDRSQPN